MGSQEPHGGGIETVLVGVSTTQSIGWSDNSAGCAVKILFAFAYVDNLPAIKKKRLNDYSRAQAADLPSSTTVGQGWPEKRETGIALTPHWSSQGELTVCNDSLLYENRIVVPKTLQRETLQKLHQGH